MYPVVEKPGRAPAYAPWMVARVSDEGLPEAAAGVEEAAPQQEQPAAQSRLGLDGLQEPRLAEQVGTISAAGGGGGGRRLQGVADRALPAAHWAAPVPMLYRVTALTSRSVLACASLASSTGGQELGAFLVYKVSLACFTLLSGTAAPCQLRNCTPSSAGVAAALASSSTGAEVQGPGNTWV